MASKYDARIYSHTLHCPIIHSSTYTSGKMCKSRGRFRVGADRKTHAYVFEDTSFICTHTETFIHENTLQHTLQHAPKQARVEGRCRRRFRKSVPSRQSDIPVYTHSSQTETHCNTLQHTATHCNTLQHSVTTTLSHDR